MQISDDCRDLLQRIFKFEPAQRITIVDMFKHRWFAEGLPVEPRQMNAEVMEENVERLQAQPHLQVRSLGSVQWQVMYSAG